MGVVVCRSSRERRRLLSSGRYASSWLGTDELRANVARFYSRHVLKVASVDASEVVITSSATSAIDALLFGVLEKGDAVLTTAPYYGSYARDVEARAECSSALPASVLWGERDLGSDGGKEGCVGSAIGGPSRSRARVFP